MALADEEESVVSKALMLDNFPDTAHLGRRDSGDSHDPGMGTALRGER